MRALLVVLVALPACYAPQLAACAVQCGSDSPCPAGLTCGDDQFCHDQASGPPCVTLTIDLRGPGERDGHVTSIPAGVDCGNGPDSRCHDIPFTAGTSVTLAADHGPGTIFAHWGGDACGGSNADTCTFTIVMQMTVSATFD